MTHWRTRRGFRVIQGGKVVEPPDYRHGKREQSTVPPREHHALVGYLILAVFSAAVLWAAYVVVVWP